MMAYQDRLGTAARKTQRNGVLYHTARGGSGGIDVVDGRWRQGPAACAQDSNSRVKTRNGRFLSTVARSGRAVATIVCVQPLRPPIEVLTVLARPSSIDIT